VPSHQSLTVHEWANRTEWALRGARIAGASSITYDQLAKAIDYPHEVWHRHLAGVVDVVRVTEPGLAAMVVDAQERGSVPGFVGSRASGAPVGLAAQAS
jgi:hypothetical protein